MSEENNSERGVASATSREVVRPNDPPRAQATGNDSPTEATTSPPTLSPEPPEQPPPDTTRPDQTVTSSTEQPSRAAGSHPQQSPSAPQTTPSTTPSVSPQPALEPADSSADQTPPQPPKQPKSPPQPPKKRRGGKKKRLITLFIILLLFAGSVASAYLFGKSQSETIIKPPEPQPINLPKQAVVVNECIEGRGKQYILPKDIPQGPIYDVVNSKVIAVEYNLSIEEIQTNPDAFSNTILKLTQDYPVDHFSLVPATEEGEDTLKNVHLIMFVVSKEEAKAITCNDESSDSA